MAKFAIVPEEKIVKIVSLKDVLILVRLHSEGKEEEFINKALELVKDNQELYFYVLALFDLTNTFSVNDWGGNKMLKFDEKQVTKNLEFNTSPGKFKGRKVIIPIHRTKNGIVAVSFKLRLKDIVKILIHRHIYLQQVPNGSKTPGINIDVSPKDFEIAVEQNEDFFEKQDLYGEPTVKGDWEVEGNGIN